MTQTVYDLYGFNSPEARKYEALFHAWCTIHKEPFSWILSTAGPLPGCLSCDNEWLEAIEVDMKLKEYEQWIEDVAVEPVGGLADVNYSFVGLAGEVGEIMEWHKKVNLRAAESKLTKGDLKSELGDAFHYLVRIARCYGWSVKDLIDDNVKKIEGRRAAKG